MVFGVDLNEPEELIESRSGLTEFHIERTHTEMVHGATRVRPNLVGERAPYRISFNSLTVSIDTDLIVLSQTSCSRSSRPYSSDEIRSPDVFISLF